MYRPRLCSICGTSKAIGQRCQSEVCYRVRWRSKNDAALTGAYKSVYAGTARDTTPPPAILRADARIKQQRGY